MAKFKIEVQEITQKIFEVEADNPQEAIASVVFRYKNGDIQLSPEDLKQTVVRQYADCEIYGGASSVTLC